MALTLFRLHTDACVGHYDRNDRTGKSCKCMIHVEGQLGDVFVRSTTRTRTWSKAEKLVKAAEKAGIWTDPSDEDLRSEDDPTLGEPIDAVIDAFIADCRNQKGRNIQGPTLSKYLTLLNRLKKFAKEHGLTRMNELDATVRVGDLNVKLLVVFKNGWPTGPLATVKTLERLRTFYRYALANGWCAKNLALELDKPKNLPAIERLPFTEEVVVALLEAARTVEFDVQQPITNFEVETFILVMRWTGLALCDTALLQRSDIKGDEIRLYRKKMLRNPKRKLVTVPIPPDVLERLKKLPLVDGKYYFAHGVKNIKSQDEAWGKRLKEVFTAAGVIGTSHQFRHTFVTDLLEQDYDISIVARYIGDSVETVEEYYSHWIESRIRRASDKLRATNAARLAAASA